MLKSQKFLYMLLGTAIAIAPQGCGGSKPSGEPPTKIVEHRPHLKPHFRSFRWKQGTRSQALKMALAGQTIPLSQYAVTATRDGKSYSGTIVGSSPFAAHLSASTIKAVVVPLKITIKSSVFDPTAPNPCDANASAIDSFRQSPLVNPVPGLSLNGINVGDVQFSDGVRRAEFWNTIHGSPAYKNEISYTFASPYELTTDVIGDHGTTQNDGCQQLGILSINWLEDQLQNTIIPALTKSHVVSTQNLILFVLKNIVEDTSDTPTTPTYLGYHNAFRTPMQSYAVIDWDTTGEFFGTSDATVASHELGEWMDDPLGTNPTPPWRGVGQDSDTPCDAIWEVGDPLSGTLMPSIAMNGRDYHLQELAFFSWFFNKDADPSVGAGSKFSANGTFNGPAKACPPGGTN